ncbi:MAG TPA: prepilin-type N-terminal cleavage/methylation domain-containing protein [Nonomuraea sp.]|nr:prepilin-type N-terminal cleavage/methylation domain-containing protein [Nonomuraea sp.]
MSGRSRRHGFTLAELIVALALALAVAGLVHEQLLRSRRLARAQVERSAMQENTRAAALILSGELGALGYDAIGAEAAASLGAAAGQRSDLLALAPGAATYLAERGGGLVCGVVAGAPGEVWIASSSYTGLRAPRPTDSLLLFVESDPATGLDDAWIHFGVASTAAAACASGEPAMAVRVAPAAPLGADALLRVTAGSPVRLAEVMELRYYASGGKSWLGMRSVSTGEAITPVAGPFADSSGAVRGMTLRWLDGSDAPTSDPAAVRMVEVGLVGVTDQPIHGRDLRRALVDTLPLTLRVALRNALGP